MLNYEFISLSQEKYYYVKSLIQRHIHHRRAKHPDFELIYSSRYFQNSFVLLSANSIGFYSFHFFFSKPNNLRSEEAFIFML